MRLMLKPGLIAIFLCVISLPGRSQWTGYHFQRQLIGIEAGWHNIDLPNEIFYRVQTNYADLRIMGITGAGDTIEAPYVLVFPQDQATIVETDFSLLNQSRQAGRFFATLESPATQKINRIELAIDNRNFDWRIQLEGSNDQREWFTLLQDYRILSIDNTISTYAFTSLHFPDAQYRYYRIAIPTQEKVELRSATSSLYSEQNAAYRPYPILSQNTQENRAEKRTEIELELPWPVPVSYLSLEVSDTFDFYRPITIQLLTDSTRTEKGWQYHYRDVYTNVLSSLEEQVFTFPPTRSRALRIYLQNQDNAPLHLGGVQIQGQAPVLKARFTEKADYSLWYGWDAAYPPNYDLSNFTDKIPATPKSLQLGPEVRIQADAAGAGPLFANRAWLWGVMIAVIGLLGWFSFKMLRSTAEGSGPTPG